MAIFSILDYIFIIGKILWIIGVPLAIIIACICVTIHHIKRK